MRILRLELFGFKSFKDKTIVAFDQNVTAIVGSNGCGKSNVVDALYWVMGDMSPKHLRGTQMTDVIFSGSKDHAPMDMAEVTMVLERNPATDPELPPQFQASTEVQITRRYYRHGESEYYINKVPSRLRDIQEFFMDTGCGAKSYSIIEQGAIGRMVAQKPEERRSIIEDVAGITKFKARKAETLRKIESSKVNLDRINDITKDLQKQLTNLKRQADKAERYKKVSEELKALEIRVASQEWIRRSDSKSEAETALQTLRSECTRAEESYSEQKRALEALEEELQLSEIQLHDKREATRSSELLLKDLEAQVTNLDTRHDTLVSRQTSDMEALQKLADREATLENDITTLAATLETLNERAREFGRKMDGTSQVVQTLKENTHELRRSAEDARKKLHTEELQQTRLTQEIQNLQGQHKSHQDREARLKLQLESLASELDMRSAEKESTVQSLEKAFATRTDIEGEKSHVTERLSDLEHKLSDARHARDHAKDELTAVKIRREHLEALERDLDGVDAAAKTLALHLRSQGTEKSLLADFIQVPSVLEKSVEAVLGRHLQRVRAEGLSDVDGLRAVLAGSESDEARSGRAPLWVPAIGEKRRGRGNFDLNSVFLASGEEEETHSFEVPGPDGLMGFVEKRLPKVTSAKQYLVNHPEVVGPMVDLIKNEMPESENAPWLALLENTWVVKNREAFAELFERMGELPLAFVSLDGDLLTAEGYLDLAPTTLPTGDQASGLVQRKREIHELAAQQTKLEEALAAAQAQLDSCVHEINTAKENFRELTARLSALDPDVEKHSLFLRQVEAQLARLTEKREILSADVERAIEEQKVLSDDLHNRSELLAQAEERRTVAAGDMQTTDAALKEALDEQRLQEDALAELASESKKLDREISEQQSLRAAVEQEKTLSAARQHQLKQELEALATSLAEIAQDKAAAEGQVQASRQTLDETRSSERAAVEAFEELRTRVTALRGECERLSQTFQELSVRIKDLEQSVAVNEVEIRNIGERVRDTYQMDFEQIPAEQLSELATPAAIDEMADPAAGKERAQALRQKLDAMGKINMVAAEEYDEIRRQYEYIFVQQQDLQDSINKLEDAIERINRESRDRFAVAFNAVNDAFQKTFPTMFGGGHAELRLTNPDDMLETGVEIIAQPPGKKLQSVTLLSGGEKALTAVSLIFGIFGIKPSPFCVLDEVDAPLDDANVGRFNKHVRLMSEYSQVILISHDKQTMESCDALFGVTMQQPGVSKIASAKLSEMRVG